MTTLVRALRWSCPLGVALACAALGTACATASRPVPRPAAPCLVHVWVETEDHGARASRLEDWTCERFRKLKSLPVEPTLSAEACPSALVLSSKAEATYCFQECAGKRRRVECPKREPGEGVAP